MEIKSLGTTGFDTIYTAFAQAFADYEMQLDASQLRDMLNRRGFNPELSFAALDGDQIVAFTLNGTGDFQGITTAYDTGTGTLADYRGQGLATAIFEYSLPYLRSAGLRQYLLEALQHNEKAVSVYRKLGFEVSREYYYFRQKTEEIARPGHVPDFPYAVKRMAVKKLFETVTAGWWDFVPSWQNGWESVRRAAGEFIGLGVFDGDGLIGYAVFEPDSGDIPQIAVDQQYRRQGIASRLLAEMLVLNRADSIKVINTDVCCTSMTGFLVAQHIHPTGRQFEMIKKL